MYSSVSDARRTQGEIRTDSLDQLLPPDHAVRGVRQFVEGLDLSALSTAIRSVPGHAGAPAIVPKILMAVWLQSTIDGIGSVSSSQCSSGFGDSHSGRNRHFRPSQSHTKTVTELLPSFEPDHSGLSDRGCV